jgi:nitrite reductase/ring-hydroxylating ferredoxin subunit
MLICQQADLIENKARGFDLDGKKIIVIKRNQKIYAYMNQCPHLGINLEWETDQFMDFEDYFLQCSSHSALFQVEDGVCVSGPCIGQALMAVSTELKNDEIHLYE